MMSTPRPWLACTLALVAAACTPVPGAGDGVPTLSARASGSLDAVAGAPLRAIADASASMQADATTSRGSWQLQESDPPRASWNLPDDDNVLTFSCDHRGRRLVLQRIATGVPDDLRVLAIDADGVRMDYPAERTGAARTSRLLTRIALDAPILDRLLIARRMRVSAGDDIVTTAAPGEALRAVVDACRRGQDD